MRALSRRAKNWQFPRSPRLARPRLSSLGGLGKRVWGRGETAHERALETAIPDDLVPDVELAEAGYSFPTEIATSQAEPLRMDDMDTRMIGPVTEHHTDPSPHATKIANMYRGRKARAELAALRAEAAAAAAQELDFFNPKRHMNTLPGSGALILFILCVVLVFNSVKGKSAMDKVETILTKGTKFKQPRRTTTKKGKKRTKDGREGSARKKRR